MSLVEQAIAKLRRAEGQGLLEPKDLSRPVGNLPAGHDANEAKRLTIDLQALRAEGYLPDEAVDRKFAEQYRQIKRPLIQTALAGRSAAGAPDPRIIMVTSALPGDGKTFTSVNLALSIARERDFAVLLIDADAPKPQISHIFGLRAERGLLDALGDDNLPIESLILPTNVPGLSILPAGAPAENAAELMNSHRMRQIIKTLCGQSARRIVLLDSPPLLLTAEGRILLGLAGQTVLVVRAGQTPKQAVQDAIAMIGAPQVGGLVLNEVPASPADHYYGYGTYGSYGDEPAAKA